jgi:acyl-coenzyme A synthetase/AMP-(fatty) acid ligase
MLTQVRGIVGVLSTESRSNRVYNQAFTAPEFASVYVACGLAGAIASNAFHALSRVHGVLTALA